MKIWLIAILSFWTRVGVWTGRADEKRSFHGNWETLLILFPNTFFFQDKNWRKSWCSMTGVCRVYDMDQSEAWASITRPLFNWVTYNVIRKLWTNQTCLSIVFVAQLVRALVSYFLVWLDCSQSGYPKVVSSSLTEDIQFLEIFFLFIYLFFFFFLVFYNLWEVQRRLSWERLALSSNWTRRQIINNPWLRS
jgi:hypothetical protein